MFFMGMNQFSLKTFIYFPIHFVGVVHKFRHALGMGLRHCDDLQREGRGEDRRDVTLQKLY